jgi:hypothetical protein
VVAARKPASNTSQLCADPGMDGSVRGMRGLNSRVIGLSTIAGMMPVIAGTIFKGGLVPPTVWFRATLKDCIRRVRFAAC